MLRIRIISNTFHLIFLLLKLTGSGSDLLKVNSALMFGVSSWNDRVWNKEDKLFAVVATRGSHDARFELDEESLELKGSPITSY